MLGSHNNGGTTGGRMYLPEGSCAPKVPLTAGPPGMPGSPWPADPNDLPRLELWFEPAPRVGVTGGPAVDTVPAAPDVSGVTAWDAGAGWFRRGGAAGGVCAKPEAAPNITPTARLREKLPPVIERRMIPPLAFMKPPESARARDEIRGRSCRPEPGAGTGTRPAT